ncbi:MAG TPA: IS21 family transposase, partial [Anaeromyxobacteraceae bacterium]
MAEIEVRIFHGTELVAVHERSFEPYARVIDPRHFDGLWRRPQAEVVPIAAPLAAMGRSLADYAAAVGGAE